MFRSLIFTFQYGSIHAIRKFSNIHLCENHLIFWAQMGRDPGPMGPNGPGPRPKGPKWAGTQSQWAQMGWDPGPMGPNGPGPRPKKASVQPWRRAGYESGPRHLYPYIYR